MTHQSATPRFFVPLTLRIGTALSLSGETVHHLHVLRAKPGQMLTLFNGEGGEFAARLMELGKRQAIVQVCGFAPREAEPPYRIVLAQGIAGGGKMDWLIEKSVELGVAKIAPLFSARSVVRLTGARAAQRHQHWQALTRAASEQCGRNRIVSVEPLCDYLDWLNQLPPPAPGEMRWLLSPQSPHAAQSFSSLPATAPAQPVTLLIGPEGGWSDDEENAARERGFTALSLGPRVLRTETAGIALLAALAARWGGW